MSDKSFSLSTFSKPSRIRALDIVQSPNWATLPAVEWQQYAETFDMFAELARLSLELVEDFAPDLLWLECKIVQQYTTHVLQSFRDYIKQEDPRSADMKQLEELEGKLETLRVRGVYRRQEDSKWIAMTIFTPVWAALTTKCRPGPKFLEAIRKTEKDSQVQEWIEASENFAPTVVVFDLTESIIGESGAFWNYKDMMRTWEIDLRSKRFPESIKALFTAAQEKLDDKTAKGRNLQAQIEAAKECLKGLLGAPFRFSNRLWWAMEPAKSFKSTSPCHTCRALYAGVQWHDDTKHSSNKTFRGGMGHIVPWRCAEADVYAQQMELKKAGFV
jgi:hypothetical protein